MFLRNFNKCFLSKISFTGSSLTVDILLISPQEILVLRSQYSFPNLFKSSEADDGIDVWTF